jgi:N-acyl-L-homoserine lactone synthetase
MIFFVDAADRASFAADIVSMHRQRKAVFVDRARWKVPVIADQEVDRFDLLEHTLYLLAKDGPDGPLLASVRLLPTSGPHLMQELYCECHRKGLPSGCTVWEASRFCTSPQVTSRSRRLNLLWQIICAVMEKALPRGIERVIFAANRALLPLALQCGWDASIVGPTRKDGDDEFTAVAAAMTMQGLKNVRERHGIAAPITFQPDGDREYRWPSVLAHVEPPAQASAP